MSLGSHPNVDNTCLLILRNRGFKLHVEGELVEKGYYPRDRLWIAEKDGFRFVADNPIELLGLVAIYDYVQPNEDKPYWWKVEVKGTDLWLELMDTAFPNAK